MTAILIITAYHKRRQKETYQILRKTDLLFDLDLVALIFFFFYFLFIYVTDCSDKGSVRTMGMIGNQGGFWTTKVKFEQQIWRALIGLNSSTVFRIYKPLIWHSSVCRKLCAVLVDMSMPMGNGQYS